MTLSISGEAVRRMGRQGDHHRWSVQRGQGSGRGYAVYAVYNVKSKDEAVRLTKRFMDLHREHWKGWEGEAEIRQVVEAPVFAPAT